LPGAPIIPSFLFSPLLPYRHVTLFYGQGESRDKERKVRGQFRLLSSFRPEGGTFWRSRTTGRLIDRARPLSLPLLSGPPGLFAKMKSQTWNRSASPLPLPSAGPSLARWGSTFSLSPLPLPSYPGLRLLCRPQARIRRDEGTAPPSFSSPLLFSVLPIPLNQWPTESWLGNKVPLPFSLPCYTQVADRLFPPFSSGPRIGRRS